MRKINFNDCINSYDKSLFYKNNFESPGADPGAIYVTKEMSEEWGGYFYIYSTGEDNKQDGNYFGAYRCYRSKDLSTWERIGQVLDGFSLRVEADAWAYRFFWAPEVIFNEKDRKFYMYYSAGSKLGTPDTEYTAVEDDKWSGLYLSVAVSDTPAGPFVMVDTSDREGGVNLNGDKLSRFAPVFNFEKKLNIGHTWSAIDISPFFAPDGNMYVYFAKHPDKFNDKGIFVYGMKMKDMITPDYSSLVQLTKNSQLYIEGKVGSLEVEGVGKEDTIHEGWVNEGPFMTYHNGLYYLTYSPYGFGARGYAIMQAVGKTPLGPFRKMTRENGNPALGINKTNDYMAGNGHHNFAYAGDEIIAIYHSHADPIKNTDENGRFKGRVVSVDKMHFVYNEEYGHDILVGNGPTASIQPVARVNAKYVNIANKAKLTTNALSGEKYLVDDVFTTQEFDWDKEAKFEKEANVTLEFDGVVSVKAVMVYNSADYAKAFKSVDEIIYTLESGEQVVACNVLANPANVNEELKFMRQGGSVVAVTDELQVKAISIKISDKYDDSNDVICVSDIVILGK